jgi:drug/metabolite transporter (DMT)-like permease
LIPVLICVWAKWRDRRRGAGVSWIKVVPGIGLIASGLILANWTEFDYVINALQKSGWDFWYGVGTGVIALLIWTWYPIRNADWLLAHRDVSPQAWITAQGLMVLPVSTISYFVAANALLPAEVGLLGETPVRMIWVMLMAGVACSWLAGALWNAMSQKLPPALGGQLIVFETIFSVIYAHVWRAEWPTWSMTIGMVMLLVGVVASLRAFR